MLYLAVQHDFLATEAYSAFAAIVPICVCKSASSGVCLLTPFLMLPTCLTVIQLAGCNQMEHMVTALAGADKADNASAWLTMLTHLLPPTHQTLKRA